MKKRQINCLGFLSLLALISLWGFWADNPGLYGFLGFLYYIRYFWVVPDEFFMLNLRKASMAAWFSEMILLVPLTYICFMIYDSSKALRTAFGLSFAAAILVFTLVLTVLEYRESVGAADD